MENNIASILFARGIMPDDFISYSTYAAVGEIVKDMERLREERKNLVEALREIHNLLDDGLEGSAQSKLESLLSKFEVPNQS